MAGAPGRPGRRLAPYAAAGATTILWSSSFVLVKLGLQSIPPLYFATLRYSLAFLILLAVDLAFTRRGKGGSPIGRKGVALLVVAGVGGYTLAQGLQFVGLYYLPAVTTSFLLNFNPFYVLLLGAVLLDTRVTLVQVAGLGLAVVGALVFFSESVAWGGQFFGVAVVIVSGVGWGVYVLAVRVLHAGRSVSPLRLTTITMGIGVAGMVGLTVASRQYAPLTTESVIIVAWLATANTALAFYLWNWSLQVIPAYELTLMQDVMLVEIALFAFFFLGEAITPVMVAGMGLVLAGVAVVQLKGRAELASEAGA